MNTTITRTHNFCINIFCYLTSVLIGIDCPNILYRWHVMTNSIIPSMCIVSLYPMRSI